MVLVECLVALFIHLIVGAIVLRVAVENIKSIEERKDLLRFYRVINSVCREVQVNYSNCYLKDELAKGEKILNYNSNLEDELINKELFNLDNGDKSNDYISISLEGTEVYSMRINIKGRLKNRSVEEEVDTIIIKNIWENK